MKCEPCRTVIELYGTNEYIPAWKCKCKELKPAKKTIVNRQIAFTCNSDCCENVPIVNGIVVCKEARYWRGVY